MKTIFKLRLTAIAIMALSLVTSVISRAEDGVELAITSNLSAITLPANSYRIQEDSIPQEINTALAAIVKEAGPQVKQGHNEVLAWQGKGYKKANAPILMKQISGALQKSGWTYQTQEGKDGVTLVTAVLTQPDRKALIGLWAVSDDALVLAWTEMLRADATTEETSDTQPETTETQPEENEPVKQPVTTSKPSAVPAGAIVLDVPPKVNNVNVMKTAMPKLPAFPALSVKPGYIRGYVKDTSGKPLVGAKLGVRSTAVGGAYSGASTKSDAKGYYEIQVPFGVAHFYSAGYTVDYADGRAALGLHPADGELDSFASNVGGVENFVLLPYGIGNRDEVQDQPQYVNNYYGGGVTFYFQIGEDQGYLPPSTNVEITFTPLDKVIDGSPAKSFVIRHSLSGYMSLLYVNNLPITTYRISVKAPGLGSVKLKETGPNGGQAFGINPKEVTDTVDLQLRPASAKAESAVAARGNWDQVTINVEH